MSIGFKVNTGYLYTDIYNKLGDDMELGAISEYNIAMAYAHQNGISIFYAILSGVL